MNIDLADALHQLDEWCDANIKKGILETIRTMKTYDAMECVVLVHQIYVANRGNR